MSNYEYRIGNFDIQNRALKVSFYIKTWYSATFQMLNKVFDPD